MKNKQYITLIVITVLGVLSVIAGILVGILSASNGLAVFFLGCIGIGLILTGSLWIRQIRRDEIKPSSNICKSAPPVASVAAPVSAQVKKNLVAHTGKIAAINQGDKINLDIWGEVREIEVFSHRISYESEDDGTGTPFNEEELAELNKIIESGAINGEDVKVTVLKYVNELTEGWDEDYYDGKITSIISPEVEINNLIIDNLDKKHKSVSVAFCGNARCDDEHGISVNFIDEKFVGCGDFTSFEFADTEELYTVDGNERVTLNCEQCARFISDWGYADADKIFTFSNIYKGDANGALKKDVIDNRYYNGFFERVLAFKDGRIHIYDYGCPTEKLLKRSIENWSVGSISFEEIKKIKIRKISKFDPFKTKLVKAIIIIYKYKDDRFKRLYEISIAANETELDKLNKFAELLRAGRPDLF